MRPRHRRISDGGEPAAALKEARSSVWATWSGRGGMGPASPADPLGEPPG
jgi:hypothetical protein